MNRASVASAPALPEPPRRWRARTGSAPDAARIARLTGELRLPDRVCALLLARGIDGAAPARDFLRPRLDLLHDPLDLPDMPRALERVRHALHAGETILVHGDYDVDGMCASALLTRVLRALGGRVVPFVPDRLRDGYDLGRAGVAAAREAGAALIVTADCGTGATDAVAAARDAGIDVVITDHHTPPDRLPDAVAIVNPMRQAERPTSLCGAGVAFKLCQALWRDGGRDSEELLWHLDLVAVATVADLMPLTAENRTLVHYGLRVLRRTRNAGLRALMRVARIDQETVTAGQIGHVLAPRLNAAGRIGDPRSGVQLLLCDDEATAQPLALELDALNANRRDLDRRMLDQALERLARDYDPGRDAGIVIAGEDWHPGVVGIVASRVVERVCRPTLLIALRGDGTARGSGRSVRGFDLYAALGSCAHLLERYGGHRAAAGLDVRADRIDALRKAFNEHARQHLDRSDLSQDVPIDGPLELGDCTAELARLIARLGPFGVGNPTPTFLARGVRAAEAREVGKGHLRARLERDGASLEAIGFGLAERFGDAGGAERPLDVVFRLEVDEWRGEERVQARLVDFRGAR